MEYIQSIQSSNSIQFYLLHKPSGIIGPKTDVGQFLAENISFEIGKILMIEGLGKLLIFMEFTRGKFMIDPPRRGVWQECPKQALRAGVLKTRNAQTPKNGFVTETLTKRIFAPKTCY